MDNIYDPQKTLVRQQNSSVQPNYAIEENSNGLESGDESREPGEVETVTVSNSSSTTFSAEYLMRPPDATSIAAAALTARKNRNKRRTRIKFEQEHVVLLFINNKAKN